MYISLSLSIYIYIYYQRLYILYHIEVLYIYIYMLIYICYMQIEIPSVFETNALQFAPRRKRRRMLSHALHLIQNPD